MQAEAVQAHGVLVPNPAEQLALLRAENGCKRRKVPQEALAGWFRETCIGQAGKQQGSRYHVHILYIILVVMMVMIDIMIISIIMYHQKLHKKNL